MTQCCDQSVSQYLIHMDKNMDKDRSISMFPESRGIKIVTTEKHVDQ